MGRTELSSFTHHHLLPQVAGTDMAAADQILAILQGGVSLPRLTDRRAARKASAAINESGLLLRPCTAYVRSHVRPTTVATYGLLSPPCTAHVRGQNLQASGPTRVARRKSIQIQSEQSVNPVRVRTGRNLEGATEPPLNTYRSKDPFIGTIKSVKRIVGPDAIGETCHVVIDHDGNIPFWEGQSFGIIPPGENPKKPGTPNRVRLYSIASSRYGDEFDGKTASLCVKRAVFWDPELKREDPTKAGICSNFLCDAVPGTKVAMTGPSGTMMLLPHQDPSATHILVATGSGIAPYRGYLRRMFMEEIPGFKFTGFAWLFLGVSNRDSLLYEDEMRGYMNSHRGHFRYDVALSREETNKEGGPMYVQHKLEEYGEEVFGLLEGGAHIYFCGLKGMMPGIIASLTKVAESRGSTWEEVVQKLKKNRQWHVEVC